MAFLDATHSAPPPQNRLPLHLNRVHASHSGCDAVLYARC